VHTTIHASWLSQIETLLLDPQRKVVMPNDLHSPAHLIDRIRAFAKRYSALGKPFAWTFYTSRA
jgi:hypothetical protein